MLPLFLIQINSTLSNTICLKFVLILSWLLPSDVNCVSTNTHFDKTDEGLSSRPTLSLGPS